VANEATVRSELSIRKQDGVTTLLNYRGQSAFTATVTGTRGPNPGTVIASQNDTAGTLVDLSGLTDPGLVHIYNQDTAGYVEYGIYDTERGVYFPFGELLPGEGTVFRFSRNFMEEFGTGTGTTPATNQLRVKSYGGSTGAVFVGAFER